MSRPGTWLIGRLVALLISGVLAAHAADDDELRVKRKEVFGFARKPEVSRAGDDVTISFAVRDYCDATVAIEDGEGRIVRHLACGVLGDNAPPPFQKRSLEQTLVWDGKDDQARYVDDQDGVVVRVSLGLKAELDKALFWSPYKRVGVYPPIIAAAKEGVYVFDGRGVDHLRLFDHEGNYVRTIHPFPAGKLDEVVGLEQWVVPQTGQRLPRKIGYTQATLLSSGSSAIVAARYHPGRDSQRRPWRRAAGASRSPTST